MNMNHAANLALLLLLEAFDVLSTKDLADRTSTTMDATSSRLRKLKERDMVALVGRGAWKITTTGREQVTETAVKEDAAAPIDRPANPADDVPKVVTAENLRKFCAYPRMSSEVARFFGLSKPDAEYQLLRHKSAAKLKNDRDTVGTRVVVLWKSDLPNPIFHTEGEQKTARRAAGSKRKKSGAASRK